MQFPKPLRQGSRVRLVAPASPFDPEKFERGIKCIQSFGLVPEGQQQLNRSQGYLAGDDNTRARELVDALEDPQVDAIWCARGGYGCTRLLPILVDCKPSGAKYIIGFSDVSALIALCFSRFGMAAVHGPVVTSLSQEPPASQDHLWRVLSGQTRGLSYQLDPTAVAGTADGTLDGTLYATNLALLTHLVGTPYLPDLSGCILAVEEVGEKPYRLDRLWTQIRQSGLLAGVVAIVLGKFTDCDDNAKKIPAEQGNTLGLAGVELPIYRGLQIGHSAPNLAIPVGMRATIADGRLVLQE